MPFDGAGFVDPDEIRKKFRPTPGWSSSTTPRTSSARSSRSPRSAGSAGRRTSPSPSTRPNRRARCPSTWRPEFLDVVAFTGHKSLLGPTGIGGLYVREGVEIRHTRAGGTGVRSAVKAHLDEYPYRLEYGTPNVHGHRRAQGRPEVDQRQRRQSHPRARRCAWPGCSSTGSGPSPASSPIAWTASTTTSPSWPSTSRAWTRPTSGRCSTSTTTSPAGPGSTAPLSSTNSSGRTRSTARCGSGSARSTPRSTSRRRSRPSGRSPLCQGEEGGWPRPQTQPSGLGRPASLQAPLAGPEGKRS